MKRHDVMKAWSNGFAAGITVAGCDDTKNEHWQAGYLAGYRTKHVKSQLLDEYLVSTGREPQMKIKLADAD